MKPILLMLAASGLVSGAGAVDYHVDNRRGDDANDGRSAEKAFRTLAKATSALKAGDVLNIVPGEPYRESLVIGTGGTAEKPIVIRGNGAVLTGLEPIPDGGWTDCGGGVFLSPNKACWGALQPQVVDRSGKVVTVSSHRTVRSERAKTLKSGEAMWNAEGVWYRTANGKSPAGLGLCGYYRESGVKISGRSHIVVEGVIAERFANDGFNVHGSCHDLLFRNVEARWNGDDGFSVHDDVEAQVRKGHFHHNADGIADVHASQTSYSEVVVEENASFGVGFYGGLRVMRDSVVRNNGGHQILVVRDADHGRDPEGDSPMHEPKAWFRNVRVIGGPRAAAALNVGAGATVCASDCVFGDADLGLRLDGGVTRIERTKVVRCRKRPVFAEKAAVLIGRPMDQAEARVEAKADGVTDVTADIQRTIDRVSAAGGGRVTVPRGDYVVCALQLKSGVELHLEDGAALLSVTNLSDYSACGRMNSTVFASGAKDVSITGKGTISGRGEFFDRVIARKPGLKLRGGWRTLTFEACENVRVEDVSLRGATSWTFFLKHNDGVIVRRIRLFGHANYCNDGIDIDSKNVLVEDCDIDAEDDAIVFKTHRPDFAVENVEVRNCRLASNSSNIKFGTESLGTFRNVRVHHCTIGCRTPSHTINPHNFPGEERGVRTHSISGIEVSAVDGGSIEDVVISDIEMGEGIDTPIFVRLARRKEPAPGRSSYLRNVTIERVTMKSPACCAIANAIAGVPGMRPQDVVVRDVDLVMMGGGTAKEAAETYADERDRAFPMPYALFKSMLPAYGFYVRHADGVRLENVRVRYADGKEERPAVVTDDADVTIENCDFMPPKGNPPLKTVVRRPEGGSAVTAFDVFPGTDTLPILAWYGVLPKYATEERLAELKEAGFNINFSCGVFEDEEAIRVLDAAAKVGMKCLFMSKNLEKAPEKVVPRVKGHPALAGYHLKDEPGEDEFPRLADQCRRIRALDPDHFCYLNLVPDYGIERKGMCYTNHIRKAASMIAPEMLSYDQYGIYVDKKTREFKLRPTYYRNLETFAFESQRLNRPFWAFALATAHASYPIPDLAQLRFQMYSNLAYGAQGLQYFTYWNPGPEEPGGYHEAPINTNNLRSVAYEPIRELNAEIQRRAFVFKGSTPLWTRHTGATLPKGTVRLGSLPSFVKTLDTKGRDAIVSLLAKGGRRFLVIVNGSFIEPLKLKLRFAGDVRRIRRDGTVVKASLYDEACVLAPGDCEIFEALGWRGDGK